MSKLLHKPDFDPYLNDTFEIHPQGHEKLELQLAEIVEKNTDMTECFSLFFRGPKEPEYTQGTFKFTHPKMEEFRLFICPVMYKKRDGVYYQAVFNRLLEEEPPPAI